MKEEKGGGQRETRGRERERVSERVEWKYEEQKR